MKRNEKLEEMGRRASFGAGTMLLAALALACSPTSSPTPVEGSGLGDIPRTISQSIAEGENAPQQTFAVRNTGACPLDYTIAINNAPWVTVSPAMGRVGAVTPETPNPAPAAITATFTTSALPRGVHSGAIVITAFCQRGATLFPAMGSPLTIEISVTVRPYVAVLSSDTAVVSVDGATLTAGSRWRTINAPGAPAPTGQWAKPFACWTGTEMLFVYTPDPAVTPSRFVGALFDLVKPGGTRRRALEGVTPRIDTSLVWNGHQIIAFGGAVATGLLQTAPTNTGWALQRANREVVILPTVGAPSARTRPLAVWTGEEMLVWGGRPGTTDLTSEWLGGPVYALTP